MATENVHYAPLFVENAALHATDEAKNVWVVMRSRKNGYQLAQSKVYRFFMPMKESLITKGGKRVKVVTPAIPNIFFINDTISHIDSIVKEVEGIEYLYIKGLPYRQPVIVRDSEMDNFIAATTSEQKVTFYAANDDNLSHIVGHNVRISHNDGWIEGELITVRGSRYRRLRVRLHDCLVAYVDLTLTPASIIEVVK